MTKNIDRYFIIAGLIFAGLGLTLGEIMGQSRDHTEMPTHAHIMLVGWIFAGLYGVIYRLWPTLKTGALPIVHFALHVIGALVMIIALYLFYSGGTGDPAGVEMIIGLGSMGVAAGWLLFLILFLMRARD